MGMYTEIIVKACIRSDIAEKEREVLDWMFNGGDWKNPPQNLPDHKFFTLCRWRMIGKCSSYYHFPENFSKYTEDYLFSRSDLKDYSDEIDNFFDWLRPLIDGYRGNGDKLCIGWKWYEEDSEPTLIYL